MTLEAKTLGDLFKERRKELNLSLKEIENATSIRLMFLHAIEDGHFDKLISSVYAQGFVRQYASFLGLDGEEIVREHAHLFSQKEPHEFDYGIGTLEMRSTPGASVKWSPSSFWLILLFVLFLFGWGFAVWFGFL